MTTRNQGSVSQAAREIREQLAAAQGAEPPAQTPTAARPAGMVVTKDGQLVPAGAPIPTDADGNPVATSVVPDATFHRGEHP